MRNGLKGCIGLPRPEAGRAILSVALVSFAALLVPGLAQASSGVNAWGMVKFGARGEGHEEWASPAELPGLEGVTSIDQSNASGYALESDGVVKAWGDGNEGALGDGSEESTESAVTVRLPAGVVAVSLGEADKAGLAVTSTGHVFVWGQNARNELCLGRPGASRRAISTPQEIPGLSGVAAVQGAAEHTLFLMKDGTVRTCGSNAYGELGLGSKQINVGGPTLIPGIEHAVEISAGSNVSAIRLEDGEVLDFGADEFGELGLGKSAPSKVYMPTEVPLPGPATSLSVGGNSPINTHVLVTVEGKPYGWGVDTGGEIGDGSTEPKYEPVLATELVSYGFTSVKASGQTSYGLVGGELYSWGRNSQGSLGDGGLVHTFSPVLIDSGVQEVSATASEASDLQ